MSPNTLATACIGNLSFPFVQFCALKSRISLLEESFFLIHVMIKMILPHCSLHFVAKLDSYLSKGYFLLSLYPP